jgi:RNA polymerase sigma factor (sigma-70 family)
MAIENLTNETELVQKCIQGDKKAQAQFYSRYSGLIWKICLRYSHDEEAAKDVFQDTMIRAFQKLTEFRFEGSFEGWLRRICVNQCLDAIRKDKSKWQDSIEDVHENLESDIQTDHQIHAQQLIGMLQSLPVGYRTVFNLYVIEGYSHAEISSMMGISESTSKSQLFKARKHLQMKLTNNNF